MKSTRYSPAMIDLLQRKVERLKTECPSVPDYAIPRPSYKTNDANGLTKAIIDYIELRGGWATRISVEGRYIEALGKRIASSVKKGTADIHACYKGKHLSIEVKIGADRQSDDQKQVQADITAAGGHYFIARSFDDFHQWFATV
jgi:hypothetical protein